MEKTAINKPVLEAPNKALNSEIIKLRKAGYTVSVEHTEDIAYSKSAEISKMYNHLDKQGSEYRLHAKNGGVYEKTASTLYVTSRRIPLLSLVLPSGVERAHWSRDKKLGEVRRKLLFDESKMPWHLQRGSALALQTIVDAHNLKATDNKAGGGLYDTMSGRLRLEIDYIFGDNDGKLSGRSLRDALVESHQRLYGKTETEAQEKAEDQLRKLDLFLHAPVTQDFKDIVSYCTDSLGIRSRKADVVSEISQHVDKLLKSNPKKSELLMFSVGCGTAQTILEVAEVVRDKGLTPHVILLDQDPIALAAAKSLAQQMGLADNIELHCERLFDRKGRPLNLEIILDGRLIDVAEDTGLREYLPDMIYKNLTRVIWNNLAKDGMMTTGNMNINRPQPEFLHGLMGWYPYVNRRTIAKGFALHEKSGVPKGHTRARVMHDGVYARFSSYKKK